MKSGGANDDSGTSALRLEVRVHSPQVYEAIWSGRGEATEAERQELAKLAISRRAGAHVIAFSADAGELPRALAALTEDAPPIALTLFDGAAQLFAPRGRGCLLRFAAPSQKRHDEVCARVVSPDGLHELERAVDEALTRIAWTGWTAISKAAEWRDGKRSPTFERTGHLEPMLLLPAIPDHAAIWRHEGDGGERAAERGPTGAIRVGVLVRERESFEVQPRADGRPLEGFELIVRRLTAPADRGALLRVELDDEDLGPWRLGDGGGAGEWSHDDFAIASDLLASRGKFRLAFTQSSGTPIASYQWGFFVRREPHGIWLTSLEPEAGEGGAALPSIACSSSFVTGELQRGLRLRAGEWSTYRMPRGYSRLTAELVASAAPATLRVELDGRPAAQIDVERGAATVLDLPIGKAEKLRLALDAAAKEAVVDLLDPALER
jgi:hypothetical protein